MICVKQKNAWHMVMIPITNIKHSLCTRYSKFLYLLTHLAFTTMLCGYRHCKPILWKKTLYRVLESLSNFPDLISNVAEIQTQAIWLYCSYLATIMVITTSTRLSWNCSNTNLNIDMKFLTVKIMKSGLENFEV